MNIDNRPNLSLPRILMADAVVCVLSGLLLVLGANALTDALHLPTLLLRAAGIFLLPYGALVAYIATRPIAPRAAVWGVIVANLLWVLASIELLVSGWGAPNALGVAFIIVQAVAVAGFAAAQLLGLRQQVSTLTKA